MPPTIDAKTRRHWITSFLASWMFLNASVALYELWLLLFPAVIPGSAWGIAVVASAWNFINFLPSPAVLMSLQAMIIQLPHPHLFLILLRLAMLVLAVALGYGLFRTREWARWGYASLCLIYAGEWGGGPNVARLGARALAC